MHFIQLQLWGRLPEDSLGEDRWCHLLCLRGAGRRSTHPHNCQQLRRVLQGPGEEGGGDEASGGDGAGEGQRERRVRLPVFP